MARMQRKRYFLERTFLVTLYPFKSFCSLHRAKGQKKEVETEKICRPTRRLSFVLAAVPIVVPIIICQ